MLNSIAFYILLIISCKAQLTKSSASPRPLFIYELTGYMSMHNQPIAAKLSKMPLYWHSWFDWKSYILANEIAWLQMIVKWNVDLSGETRGSNESQYNIELIPMLSFFAVQWYFYWSTERKCLNHAQEWKLIRFFSSGGGYQWSSLQAQ